VALAALDAMFHVDRRTIRFGIVENLFGYDEIKSFRAARSPRDLAARSRTRSSPLTVATVAVASTLFHRATTPGKVGRQTQTWVRFPGRLARGSGACERDRGRMTTALTQDALSPASAKRGNATVDAPWTGGGIVRLVRCLEKPAGDRCHKPMFISIAILTLYR
jgi:Protein of unknown function (DUF3225)